ncbi:hypothetical protein C1J03_22985 [Sulfitobacter sp. SK012]|uniref:flagellar hook-length control protein FliK n=1 Tax=Sulfitobacter sp. SK012 TaxID=1389005 RepID=UPI000E0B8859|nr:flagellar hook-length control protein FliK [Sulfitobacter sp. SK012]AXI48610.1 hypothetical protein C1J03_22985 [Sulfitobacter sp. SK012]
MRPILTSPQAPTSAQEGGKNSKVLADEAHAYEKEDDFDFIFATLSEEAAAIDIGDQETALLPDSTLKISVPEGTPNSKHMDEIHSESLGDDIGANEETSEKIQLYTESGAPLGVRPVANQDAGFQPLKEQSAMSEEGHIKDVADSPLMVLATGKAMAMNGPIRSAITSDLSSQINPLNAGAPTTSSQSAVAIFPVTSSEGQQVNNIQKTQVPKPQEAVVPTSPRQETKTTESVLRLERSFPGSAQEVATQEIRPPNKPTVQSSLLPFGNNGVVEHARQHKSTLLSMIEPSSEASWEQPRHLSQTAHSTFNRPEIPTQVGRQIASALSNAQNKPVELALNPVELGRVRMTIASEDGGIVVHILAERADTLELMRRNIGQLGQEFQALGYESIAFSFGEGETQDGNRSADDNKGFPHGPELLDLDDNHSVVHLSHSADGGIDIRI